MLAAEMVDTTDCREAAILGGIVRCVISCGKINVPWVGQYTADILGCFNLEGNCRPASLTEVAAVVERFQLSYSQPFSAG